MIEALSANADSMQAGAKLELPAEPDDEIGTINLFDATRVLAGLREVVVGHVDPLDSDVTQPSPHPHRPCPFRTHIISSGIVRDDSLIP